MSRVSRPLVLRPSATAITASMDSVAAIVPLLKEHLRITSSDFDEMLTQYCTSAVKSFELETNRAATQKTLVAKFQPSEPAYDRYRSQCNRIALWLPFQPVTSIDRVSYIIDGETSVDFDSDSYLAQPTDPNYNITFKQNALSNLSLSSLDPAPIQVSYTAGIANPRNMDPLYLQAILQLATGYFVNRSPTSDQNLKCVPMGLKRILDLVRIRNYAGHQNRINYRFVDYAIQG